MTSSTTPSGPARATPAEAVAGPFDVREFARTARGNHRAELDLDAIAAEGIDEETARLIRVLRDLDRSTMERMRNLLVTATHKDARVTAFLTTWAFEKFWIADALDAVLEATGHDLVEPAKKGAVRQRRGERAEHRGPVRRAIIGNIQGVQLVAAHVTAGLIDEWVTSAAYRRLGDIAHTVGSVVDLVLTIKDRHIRFLSEEAHRRLAGSSRAQRLTRKIVKQTVFPVGVAGRPGYDRSFFEAMVFGDDAGRQEAERTSALVASLPGLRSMGPALTARLTP